MWGPLFAFIGPSAEEKVAEVPQERLAALGSAFGSSLVEIVELRPFLDFLFFYLLFSYSFRLPHVKDTLIKHNLLVI